MKFAAVVLLAASVAFLETSACSAQQAVTPPVEQTAPVAIPAPAPPAPVAAERAAPAPAHTRSLKTPSFSAPVPAGASKPDSGTPDVVVGGLPGALPGGPVEKQP